MQTGKNENQTNRQKQNKMQNKSKFIKIKNNLKKNLHITFCILKFDC